MSSRNIPSTLSLFAFSVCTALLLILLVAILPALSFGQSARNFKADVDALVSRFVKTGEVVGLEIGVISNRDQPQFFAYGEAVKGSGQKPSPSTLFQIGSVTKTFTGILLALFVERGVVQFDDPLQKYVPTGIQVPSYNGRQILLIDLATHMSALARNPPMTKRQTRLTVDQMYEVLRKVRLTREPGRQYEYSNWGFGLLADALVRVAKAADYHMLVEREVLSKLGMNNTTIHPNTQAETKVAQGYLKDGHTAARNMATWPALDGAGALYSTASDMVKYLLFNLGLTKTSLNSILSSVLQPRVHGGRRSIHSTALAWEMLTDPKSNLTVIGKTGGTLGFQAYIGFIRGQRAGVVVLANSVATRSAVIGRQISTLLATNQASSECCS